MGTQILLYYRPTNPISESLHADFATGVIFLDLKKAFDTVNHNILINKLASYGIKDNELDWFKSYLCNRSQAVHVNSFLILKLIISEFLKAQFWVLCYSLFL